MRNGIGKSLMNLYPVNVPLNQMKLSSGNGIGKSLMNPYRVNVQ